MKTITRLVTFLYLVFHISPIAIRGIINRTPAYVDNCGKWNVGDCVQCRDGYVFTPAGSDGRIHCTLSIPGCATYTTSGSCATCGTGRSLVHNVVAANACPCPAGTQTFDGAVTCLTPSTVQPGCTRLQDANNCDTCIDGHFRDVVKLFPTVFGCSSCSAVLGRPCSKCYLQSNFSSLGRVICQA